MTIRSFHQELYPGKVSSQPKHGAKNRGVAKAYKDRKQKEAIVRQQKNIDRGYVRCSDAACQKVRIDGGGAVYHRHRPASIEKFLSSDKLTEAGARVVQEILEEAKA